MEIITKEYKVYPFAELDEKGKDAAISNLADINLDFEWWEGIFEDANTAWLKITSFGLDRSRDAKGQFIANGAYECALLIIKDHGAGCETFKTAKNYLEKRKELIDSAEKDADGEIANEYAHEQDLDDLNTEFLQAILEDYSIILQREYEDQASNEAIIETIEANNYTFLADGKMFNQ